MSNFSKINDVTAIIDVNVNVAGILAATPSPGVTRNGNIYAVLCDSGLITMTSSALDFSNEEGNYIIVADSDNLTFNFINVSPSGDQNISVVAGFTTQSESLMNKILPGASSNQVTYMSNKKGREHLTFEISVSGQIIQWDPIIKTRGTKS